MFEVVTCKLGGATVKSETIAACHHEMTEQSSQIIHTVMTSPVDDGQTSSRRQFTQLSGLQEQKCINYTP